MKKTDQNFCHVRYAVILTDYKRCRYIIAVQDSEDYPIVFLREWVEDPYFPADYYTLYGNALAKCQAEEILELMKARDTSKARSLLKKFIKDDEPYCEQVGPVILDDMIPDEWYDVWKEMEFVITSYRHITGYWEADIERRNL